MRHASIRPFLLPATAAVALLAAHAPADVTALRWGYPGDCSAVKTHSARAQDTVTLVVGEPLDLEVVGTGLAPGLGGPPGFEAPAGIVARVKTANAQGLSLSLIARSAGPVRGTRPLRIVPGSGLPVDIALRAVERPRIRSIRLAIPGLESLASVKVAQGATYSVSLTGVSLQDVTFVRLPGSDAIGVSVRDGVLRMDPRDLPHGGHALLAPANFLWTLDSCPLSDPGGAALAVEISARGGVSGTVATLAPSRPVSCGSQVRTALDDSWCASLPPPAPRSDAVVAGPPIRWTLKADDDVVVGAFQARLTDNHFREYDVRSVPFLRPGETTTFETPRPGSQRRVMRDAACAGCFDLGASPPAEPTYRVEVGPRTRH